MRSAFSRHKNFPLEGIAILTNHPLTNLRPLFDHEGRAFALLADSIAEGCPFMIACVHLRGPMSVGELWSTDKTRAKELETLFAAWRDAGSLPMIIGGFLLDYFNSQSANSGYRAVFGSAIVFFVLGTVFVSRIRSVR